MRRSRAWWVALAASAILSALVLPANPAGAAFPGANGRIAWSKSFLTRDSEIFVMNPDGSGQHQLSHNDQNDFFPAWSADGSKIAFESSGSDVDIHVMNADGSDEHNVTNDPSGPDRGPAWSPDGTRIAFYKQNFDGTSSIWVMASDGSGQTPITDETAANQSPAWSPDGTRIAFSSDRDGNVELYLINPDGTGLQRLTFSMNQHEENPNWSPDGTRIAYDACAASSFPCPGSANYEIFAMRADGSRRHRLTNDPSIDWNPAWSPDGTQIVFRSDRSPDGTQLWKMNADGTGVVQLTFGDFQGGVDPDWQPIP